MSETTTVVLKSGKNVVHDADLYDVKRDGSLHLYKSRPRPKAVETKKEPLRKSRWWHFDITPMPFPLPPFPPKTVRVYAAGEWKEFY